MTVDPDLGGDPPCWAHLHDEDDEAAASTSGPHVVADLDAEAQGSGGAVWSLPHGGDLDANMVRLDAGAGVGAHVNDEVDVLIYVQAGSAEITIDGTTHRVGPHHVALIPRGLRRSIMAGPSGVAYLSVHRRRGPLTINARMPQTEAV